MFINLMKAHFSLIVLNKILEYLKFSNYEISNHQISLIFLNKYIQTKLQKTKLPLLIENEISRIHIRKVLQHIYFLFSKQTF